MEDDKVIQAIRKDLQDNIAGTMRAIRALVAYVPIETEAIEELRRTLNQFAQMVDERIAAAGGTPGSNVSYFAMEPREAALVDVDIFGPGRTIEQVQDSVLARGFIPKRSGAIRSAVKAKFNQAFFAVSDDDQLSLTDKGQEEARRLRQKYRIG